VIAIRSSLLAVSILLALPAHAGDAVVTQKDKSFDQSEINIRSGDRIVFRNQDTVVHNIYSTTPGFEFEIKTQLPGQTSEEKFVGDGQAEVRCAIHPQMKLTVNVAK
jgi:plastocyanin